ncbi:MAG: hypothetical protein AB7L09_01580 [Nitrospira sp.]
MDTRGREIAGHVEFTLNGLTYPVVAVRYPPVGMLLVFWETEPVRCLAADVVAQVGPNAWTCDYTTLKVLKHLRQLMVLEDMADA